jgi:hypothetical protein
MSELPSSASPTPAARRRRLTLEEPPSQLQVPFRLLVVGVGEQRLLVRLDRAAQALVPLGER